MRAGDHLATEERSLDEVLERLPDIERRSDALLRRLRSRMEIRPGARVLDIGAAQGLHVIALRRAGLEPVGLEPWEPAIETGRAVGERLGEPVELVQGVAERLEFPDASFDLVLAVSVMEHVEDPDQVIREVARVLRPGGGFYFYTSSAVCPRQHEIRHFPAFPWYPQPLKRRIMDWAMENRPELVGHTQHPAYHWYTPWGTRRMLTSAGFSKVFDRWELKLPDETSGLRRTALEAAQRSRAVRLLGDLAVPESAYLAIR